MRSSLQVLAAVLLATAFAAPVTAATPGGATEETLSGVLEAVHVDEFSAGRERERYLLRTSRGITPLEFADGGPEGYGGATVTVTGTRAGKAIRVESSRAGRSFRVTRAPRAGETATVEAMDGTEGTTGSSTATVTTTSLATATAAAPVAKSIAVVLINFTNLATKPYTKATVLNALTGSSTSARAFLEEESKGRMTVTGDVFGWYTIPATTTGCDWTTWHTLGLNAATAAGVNLNAYTNVMFIWPKTSQCGFAGMAYVPGKYSYLNGTISAQVMTHELGHNLGLGHANARNCTVGGTRVTIASAANCTTQTYADPFSTMGNNALRHNHGSQLGELGWLESSEKVTGGPGNSYTLTPYLGAAGVKLVRIPRGDGSFFDLDVRTPHGSFDNFSAGSPAVTGVTIRVGLGTASPTNNPKGTELLDTTPSTTDLSDAPLAVGRTMTDPVSGISFTTMSSSSAGVVVRVRESVAPSLPASLTATATGAPAVNLTWTAATDNVAVGSYQIKRGGSLAATVKASVTSWTDVTAQPGASYTYTVAAVDTSGNSGPARTASVTMPAGPVPPPAPSSAVTPTPFTDIEGSMFKSDIEWAYLAGITSGCSAERYCPDGYVTREQMASFLARALHLAGAAPDAFTDDETSIHEPNINLVAAAGITSGCGTGKFCPTGLVSREQMASFLARALHLAGAAPDAFTDDETSIHEPNINLVARDGIAAGCGGTKYCPTANVTRGQMAAFLHRAFRP